MSNQRPLTLAEFTAKYEGFKSEIDGAINHRMNGDPGLSAQAYQSARNHLAELQELQGSGRLPSNTKHFVEAMPEELSRAYLRIQQAQPHSFGRRRVI